MLLQRTGSGFQHDSQEAVSNKLKMILTDVQDELLRVDA